MQNTRSTRKQPFCWQEKKILRLFRTIWKGNELSKIKNLYATITEIDSDFNGKDIKYYTKTIHSYSGLPKEWIPSGLKILQELKIIEIETIRNKSGAFLGNILVFTPDNISEEPHELDNLSIKAITVKGLTVKGKSGALEDSTYLEDSILSEDNLVKKNIQKEKSFSDEFSCEDSSNKKTTKELQDFFKTKIQKTIVQRNKKPTRFFKTKDFQNLCEEYNSENLIKEFIANLENYIIQEGEYHVGITNYIKDELHKQEFTATKKQSAYTDRTGASFDVNADQAAQDAKVARKKKETESYEY